ncbi:MAG: RluA family pseudouridine synthase [Pseudomonadota bacterium]|nr:RluA family pseudouridine synthase [Pseudomonadota bacterium]
MSNPSQELSAPNAFLTLEHTGAQVRLDHFLHQHFPDISVKKWKQAINTAKVSVDGQVGRKGSILSNSARVNLPAWLPASLTPGPPRADTTIKPVIIFEDDELLVIDKPAGIHTHPLNGNELGTLANGLIATYPTLNGIGFSPLQPGLLNRLDRDTSGLVLVAKSQKSWKKYRQLFSTRQLTKIYLGIVHGIVAAPLTIDTPLIHHPQYPERMSTVIPDHFTGRRFSATTIIEPLSYFSASTEVQLTMKTGVMHQLRVHSALSGHPLVGDLLYGQPENKAIDEQTGRLLLHAFQLQFPDGRQFTAPIDWNKAL